MNRLCLLCAFKSLSAHRLGISFVKRYTLLRTKVAVRLSKVVLRASMEEVDDSCLLKVPVACGDLELEATGTDHQNMSRNVT